MAQRDHEVATCLQVCSTAFQETMLYLLDMAIKLNIKA